MPELPLEIWQDRIENELKSLDNLNIIEDGSIARYENNVEFILNIKALGFTTKPDGNSYVLVPIRNHRVSIKINRTFPYPGGIDFSWLSYIFHPNIHPVELSLKHKIIGTGYICLNVLKKWSRLSDLDTTVKALEMLVENPNPEDPLNYDLCLEATEYFKKNDMAALRKKYSEEIKDLEEEEEEEDDDIIIIED